MCISYGLLWEKSCSSMEWKLQPQEFCSVCTSTKQIWLSWASFVINLNMCGFRSLIRLAGYLEFVFVWWRFLWNVSLICRLNLASCDVLKKQVSMHEIGLTIKYRRFFKACYLIFCFIFIFLEVSHFYLNLQIKN